MELREAVGIILSEFHQGGYSKEQAANRILSLLQADVSRREREAFVECHRWVCEMIEVYGDVTSTQAEAEAARKYPENASK